MKALTILAAAATLFAGASSVALAGQRDWRTTRDTGDIRREIRNLDRKIEEERREIAMDRDRRDWSKLRHDRDELNRYINRRDALREGTRGERRYYRRSLWP